MFRVTKPTAAAIEEMIAAAERLPSNQSEFLSIQNGLEGRRLPFFFAHDFSKSRIGNGESNFATAWRAFEEWEMFNLAWARVANPLARIDKGQIVAVEVRSLGVWSVNLSHIVETLNTPTQFGFTYKTTSMHVEEGEECFLLELEPGSGEVTYRLEAVSRPQDVFTRLGLPVTRVFQHRFARDSHRRMREIVSPVAV